MKYSFKIGSVWGIPIELHLTFILLMIAVFIFTYPNWYSFVLVLFLFVFVVLHELSHSLVARRYNIKVRKIVLYPIGGVSEIEEIQENPRTEWRVAVAGPVASFVIGAVLLIADRFVTIETPGLPGLSMTESLLFTLGGLNLLLGAFNLIPAFPMDGGRVFRGLLAGHMKYADATKYAAYLGRIFGISFAIFGFIILNPFLIIIGLFVYVGASEEAEATIFSTSIAGVRVKDVMQSEKGVAAPETTLSEAFEIIFKSRHHDILVEKEGEFLGIVTWTDVIKIKPEERNILRVDQLPIRQLAIFADESVLEANKIMTNEKVDLLPVVDRTAPAKVIGVFTKESLSRAIEKAKELG